MYLTWFGLYYTCRELLACVKLSCSIQVVLRNFRFRNVEILGKDLETFAAHAKRATVTPQDVRLAARKQPQIISKIDDIVNVLDEQKKKRRKKNDPPA